MHPCRGILWHFHIWTSGKPSMTVTTKLTKLLTASTIPQKYIGTKSTTLIPKSSIEFLPTLALKIEREATFILKMHSEYCTSHALENNSSKEKNMHYRKREESSCRTGSNCRSWMDLVIKWLLCIFTQSKIAKH